MELISDKYFIIRKLIALQRAILWNWGGESYIRVAEFPKSGGTWLSQMLSTCLGLPFPRNRILGFESCILQSHYLSAPGKNPVIWLIRDGRDVMISCYYHFLIGHEYSKRDVLKKWRDKMPFSDIDNISQHLTQFIEIFHHEYKVGGLNNNWGSHCASFSRVDHALCVKYEDLLESTTEELEQIIIYLKRPLIKQHISEAVRRYSFKSITGRERGREEKGAFIRRGMAGEWKSIFNMESASLFNELYGEQLVELGYELNSDWLNEFSSK